MERGKYSPDEIDRLIDEEISLIDMANTEDLDDSSRRGKSRWSTMIQRPADWLRVRFKPRNLPQDLT